MGLKALMASAVDVLFPRGCAACRGRGWPFCPACASRVGILGPPGCARCGRPRPTMVPSCPDCPPTGLAWHRAPFLYEGPVREALLRFKFGGQRSLADAFGPAMARLVAARPRPPPRTTAQQVAIVWVPLGPKRRRERGFDQAQVLARSVARLTGIPAAGILQRSRETAPQAMKTAADRRQALAGAFRCRARPPAVVVLIDDILTTGATAGECARLLRAEGTEHVVSITAARALNGPLPARCYNPGRAPDWVCGCPEDGPSVVDASRRRNDPRKATLGR